MSKDVASGDSTCTCDIKWEGTGCGEPGCPTNDELKKCSGHGSCITRENLTSTIVPGSVNAPAVSPVQTVRNHRVLTIAQNAANAVMVCASVPGFTGDGCEIRSLCGPSCERFGKSMGTVTMTKWNACAKKATRASTACTKLTMVAAEFHCWRLV